MPRKYRAARERSSVFPPTWWMLQDLQRGPQPMGEEEQQAAHRLELHERFGLELTTDEYVALARRRLAASPAVVVPGAVGDVATEAKIAYLLGPDLTAAVRRLYPNSSLSSWVSRN